MFHPAALLLLITALTNALYQILTRKLVNESAHTTLFYSALVGTVALSLALPWGIGDSVLPWQDGALLLLLGLCAGLGHWAMIGAYLLAPATLLTPFTYLQMVWAVAYGYLIFDQLPDRWSALGMTVIVGSGLLLALQERQRVRWPNRQ